MCFMEGNIPRNSNVLTPSFIKKDWGICNILNYKCKFKKNKEEEGLGYSPALFINLSMQVS